MKKNKKAPQTDKRRQDKKARRLQRQTKASRDDKKPANWLLRAASEHDPCTK